MISGSNAGSTTLAALTVTGATTLTGAVTGTNASNDLRGISVNMIKDQSVTCSTGVTFNANVGTTQPVNFTGTGASAYVKADIIQIEGADATDQIRDAVVDDTIRIDASALNTLSSHDPGEAIMGATDLGTGSGLTSLATAAELAKVPKSDSNVSWNATALDAIQSECDQALVANQDNGNESQVVGPFVFFEFQVAIPGNSHKTIRKDQ